MVSIIPDGELAYGIQLPVQAQSQLFAEEWESGAGVEALARMARVADDAGFLYVAVCDHVAIPADRIDDMGAAWWDPVATLSYLAAVTSRVRLLSHVYVLPYRHPLQAAKHWATLDALSSGRAILGVGAGHVEDEFEALGVDFSTRGSALDTSIDAVRAALATDQQPSPAQEQLPIWVGGSSPSAMRRAAVRGDGWLPQGPPREGMAEGIRRVIDHRAATMGDEPIDIGALSGPLYVGEPDWDVGRCVSGPPERIADYLRTYHDMGASHVQVRFRSRNLNEQCDQMQAFAAEVAPLLNR